MRKGCGASHQILLAPSPGLEAPWTPNLHVYLSPSHSLESSHLSQIRHLNTQTVTRRHLGSDGVSPGPCLIGQREAETKAGSVWPCDVAHYREWQCPGRAETVVPVGKGQRGKWKASGRVAQSCN